MEDDNNNKQHKRRLTGAKASKKSAHDKAKRGLELEPNRGSSNKAFGGPGAGSSKARQAKRTHDRLAANMRLPTEDKTLRGVLVPDPPLVVAVAGPPGSGKTTLIKSMVRFYAGRSLNSIRGPITVAAGRSRRITFIEVPNSVSAMCDVVKVADLLLLMIDGAFGFEMETFEMLSLGQVHGLPLVMGVVSHLDQLKTNKQLKKTKQLLRHRFWHEVSEAAPVLCLAPMMSTLYRSSDVLKLHRHLVTCEPKLQNWKGSHGFVLFDRHEDITRPDDVAVDPRCNRTIAFYGYLRGHPMRDTQHVHIPGLGDFAVAHLSMQDDPCPPLRHNDKAQGNRLRHLTTKHKQLYAPYCDVGGGVVYDDDQAYIYNDPDAANTSRSGEGLGMLGELQRNVSAIDEQLRDAGNGPQRRPMLPDNAIDDDAVRSEASDTQTNESVDDDDDDDQSLTGFGALRESGEGADDVAEEGMRARGPHDTDSVRIHHRSTTFDWSDAEHQRYLKIFFVTGGRDTAAPGDDDEEGAEDDRLSKGYESVDEEEEEDSGGLAAPPPTTRRAGEKAERPSEAPPQSAAPLRAGPRPESDEHVGESRPIGESDDLIYYFLSGKCAGDADAIERDFMREITASAQQTRDSATAPQHHGDTTTTTTTNRVTDDPEYAARKKAKKAAFDDDVHHHHNDEGKNNTNAYYHRLVEEQTAKREAVESVLGATGDDVQKKIALVGFFSGLYVRLVLRDVPVEFLQSFDPCTPMFAGALNAGGDHREVVHGRLKRHRWYSRILKAQDPLCLSIGWRRIQTQPIFATEDPNGRHRYLKYTPKHMHCLCAFYAPVVPPNTGFVVIPVRDTARTAGFRPRATGFTIGVDTGSAIVKKLKLTGVPERVEKTTCFIKGMFNSDIEAAKFVGAKLKAVSGLRGIIRKVLKRGIVRCTFEDKLLRSDIVFLRAWKPVEPPRYCEDVRNLLVKEWVGMRTMAELRRDMNLPAASAAATDSNYKPIKKRKEVDTTAPVHVALSRTMRLNLPFEHKEEYVPLQKEANVVARAKAVTVVAPEPRELVKQALLETLVQQGEDLSAHEKQLRSVARHKASLRHKDRQEELARKIKAARKEQAKRQDFKAQRKSTRSSTTGKKKPRGGEEGS